MITRGELWGVPRATDRIAATKSSSVASCRTQPEAPTERYAVTRFIDAESLNEAFDKARKLEESPLTAGIVLVDARAKVKAVYSGKRLLKMYAARFPKAEVGNAAPAPAGA